MPQTSLPEAQPAVTQSYSYGLPPNAVPYKVFSNPTLEIGADSVQYMQQPHGPPMITIRSMPSNPHYQPMQMPMFNPQGFQILSQYYEPRPRPSFPPMHATVPQETQQPRNDPLPQRTKKFLNFVNPETNEAVQLKKTEANATSRPSSIAPKSAPSKSPTVATDAPAQVDDTADICKRFSRMVSNVAIGQNDANKAPVVEQNVNGAPVVTTNGPPVLKIEAPVAKPVAIVPVVPTTAIPNEVVPEPQAAVEVSPQKISVDVPAVPVEQTPEAVTVPAPEEPVAAVAAPASATEEPAAASVPKSVSQKELFIEYENQLKNYLGITENVAAITQSNIYSRELVQILRNVIKHFKTVTCPISEPELKRIGIDRGTMPTVLLGSGGNKRFSERRDNFNPEWAPNSNQSVRYAGRHSGAGGAGRGGRNANRQRPTQVIARPSIQRAQVQRLVRGKGAWTPNVMNTRDASENERIRKEVRGILNKLTPSNYATLSKELTTRKLWDDEENLSAIIDLIFVKAVEEPTFVGIYSDLCSTIHKAEMGTFKDNGSCPRKFYNTIIKKCQTTFEHSTTEEIANIDKLKKEVAEETDEEKSAKLKESLEDSMTRQKRFMVGTIRFISELYRIKFLSNKVLHHCCLTLLQRCNPKDEEGKTSVNEQMIEFSVVLIESIGPHYGDHAHPESLAMNQFVQYLEPFKQLVSNRVRFMILGLHDLAAKNFVKKNSGPKTKEEVKQDVQKEEEKNRRERDAYESNDRNAYSSYGNRNNERAAYNGRKSDSNNRRGKTIIVPSTPAVRKDTNLNKCAEPEQLKAKPWNSNAGASKVKYGGRLSTEATSSDVRKQSFPSNDVRRDTAAVKQADAVSRANSTTPPLSNANAPAESTSPGVSEADFDVKRFSSEFKEIVEDYKVKAINVEAAVQKLIELNAELKNPVVLFKKVLHYGCEVIKKDQVDARIAVTQLVVKVTQQNDLINAFFQGFKEYCEYVNNTELHYDVPHIVHTLPDFVARIIACDVSIEGARPESTKFNEGLKVFNDDYSGNVMFANMLGYLVKVFVEHKEGDIQAIIQMMYNEFTTLEAFYKSEKMDQLYSKVEISVNEHKNLKSLLSD